MTCGAVICSGPTQGGQGEEIFENSEASVGSTHQEFSWRRKFPDLTLQSFEILPVSFGLSLHNMCSFPCLMRWLRVFPSHPQSYSLALEQARVSGETAVLTISFSHVMHFSMLLLWFMSSLKFFSRPRGLGDSTVPLGLVYSLLSDISKNFLMFLALLKV